MKRPRTNLKTHGIQSSERHTCSGHNAQTNDYFTTVMCKYLDFKMALNSNYDIKILTFKEAPNSNFNV